MEIGRNTWDERLNRFNNSPGYSHCRAAGKTYEDIKKAMADAKKPRVRICVEGYNTSLPEADIKIALFNHFKSCGKIYNIETETPKDPTIETPKDPTIETPKDPMCFYLYSRRWRRREKALQLNGSDVGGWTVAVRVSPEEDKSLNVQQLAALSKAHFDKKFMYGISVKGYYRMDSEDDLKDALIKDFAPCGEITHVIIPTDHLGRFFPDNCNYIYFSGEVAVDRALKRGGSFLTGLELVVQALPKKRLGSTQILPHVIQLGKTIWDRGSKSVEDTIENFLSVSPMMTD